MHPALWLLYRLYGKASWRRMFRSARTIRGALVLLVLVVWLGGSIGFLIFGTFYLRSHPAQLEDFRKGSPVFAVMRPDWGESYLPFLMLFMWINTVLRGNAAAILYFTPAEIDFLYPGPFLRRQLLIFKIVRNSAQTVWGALLFSMMPTVLMFPGTLQAFVGALAFGFFMSFTSLAATFVKQIVAESAFTRARKAAFVALGVLAALALPRALGAGHLAHGFRESWAGQVLMAPVQVFANIMFARDVFPDLIGWTAAGLAIDLALLALVLRLNADFTEWASSVSERIYAIRQNVQRGGGMVAKPMNGRAPRTMPVFPWWGGAGPIAWRQVLLTVRKSRSLLSTAAFGAIGIVVWNTLAAGRMPSVSPGFVVGILGYLTFIYTTTLPLCFRGDVMHFDVLKGLPVRPMAVAAGELGGCTAFFWGFQLLFLAVYGVATLSGGWMIPAAAILAPGVNWVMLALGSVCFLLFPVATTPGANADLHNGCRAFFSIMLMFAGMVPLLGIPAALGAGAYLAGGQSWPALIATALVTLVVEAVPMTMLAAWAFGRFDPAAETPA